MEEVDLFECGFHGRGVVSVGEIEAVCWAGYERTPERAALLAFFKTRDVQVAGEAALLEGGGEVVGVDFVGVEFS